MSYVSIPLQLNAEAMAEEAFATMEANFPGWTPDPKRPEVAMIRAVAHSLTVPLAQLASDVADEIFRSYGEEIVKVLPHQAAPASAKVAFTALDTAGYSIPAGTQIEIARSGSEKVAFRTVAQATIPAGSSEVKEVGVEAIETGLEGNNLSAGADLVDALAYITGVKLEGVTGGGAAAEESSVYLSRLVEVMRTLGPRPIRAGDVAVIGRTVAGVQRVAVAENTNEAGETGKEKTTTLAPIGADGQPVASSVKEALKALLAAKREINYVFGVVEPTYTVLYVEAAIASLAGFGHAEVVANVEAALRSLLDPSLWGTGEQRDRTRWENIRLLRFQDVVTAINNVRGVDYYSTLKIKKAGGTFGIADVELGGLFPLPGVPVLTIT